jgi:hypothetical protein
MQRTSCNMQQDAQVKPLSRRHCNAMPCRGHAMPCWPPAPALRAPAHWFGTSCMAYSARRTLQCTACMLNATGYKLHECCNLQRTTCSMVACMLAAGTCAASISAVVPGSVPSRCAGLRPLLRHRQGACEPSRSMFPFRACARRARGVPQRFRASKGCSLAADQAYWVIGRAVECMRREEPRRQMPPADGREHGRGRLRRTTLGDAPGARLPPVYRSSSRA